MAISGLILATGEILVTETASLLGLYAYEADKVKFGTVDAVYSTCDKVAIGDGIIFNPETARDFIYGSTRYFIIKEDSINGIEPPIP